jgi:glycosyltransferase involved in cell wall biosynthesis
MRYLWDQYFIYRKNTSFIKRIFMSLFFPPLRLWDLATAARVDHFIANSSFVARRIAKFYRRDATVVHPPVDIDGFSISSTTGDYYLCVGQLVRYKRVDIAVEAFRQLGRKLVIVGTGEELAALRKTAPPTVEFLGWQSSERIAELYRNCRALIFPGEEDFGIVPLEAMASGRPVIAYGAGGALDTIVPGRTGLFFPQQTAASLRAAVETFEHLSDRFDPAAIRAHAERFSNGRFRKEFAAFVNGLDLPARQAVRAT